jgi:micrococcal nuclease
MVKTFYALLLLFLFMVTFNLPAFALTGVVVSVHDGDIHTLLDDVKVQHKIRLAQIDAPELGQEWGRAAKKALSDLVYHRNVSVVVETKDP